jgi:inositol-1,4,5-trisphosphate 5-phosphatase
VFVRTALRDKISGIQTFSLKTAFYGLTGNKGATSLRFNYQDSSFAFINVHLNHKQDGVEERIEMIREVMCQTFNSFGGSKHDFKCLLGDLNFRIDLDGG